MTTCDLSDKTCAPCNGEIPAMSTDAAQDMMTQLHTDWAYDTTAQSLTRAFAFKGFAKATELANLAAWHGNKQGHHPDIAFGWGYCRVTYTTHEINGLSENDFICAAKLDVLVA